MIGWGKQMTDNDRELFSLSDEQQKLIEAGFRLKGTPVIEKVDMHEIMTSLVRSNPQETIDDMFLFGRGATQAYGADAFERFFYGIPLCQLYADGEAAEIGRGME